MDLNIIVDTRERMPLWKESEKVTSKKLDVGDYSIKNFENKFSIERKSPNDLFGSLGKGHKQFKAEITRAKDYDYFAIVVETNYTNIINKEFEGAHYCKMRGYVITSILFTLHMKYGIPFFLVNGRKEAKRYVRELMNAYLKTREIK